MQIDPSPPSASARQQADQGPSEAMLRKVAVDLEAAFIAEMLKHAGMGEGRAGIGGGGAGEGQFASLLRAEHARLLAESGGIGLAESLFRALVAREVSSADDGPSTL